MAERKEINLDIVIKADAARTTREIKQSIKELNDEILRADAGSDAFIRASQKAGELKDKLDDAKDSIKSFNASPIENISNSFGSLGNKLKSLDFGGAKQEFSNLSTSFLGLSKNILGIGPATSVASAGFRILGGAIAATGIGALVIAVVALIANFDTLKTSGGLIGKTFTAIGDTINKLIQYVKDLTDSWGLTAFAAQDAAKKQIESQEKAAKNAEEWYARNGDKYDEFSKRKIKADIDYKNSKLELDKDETKSEAEKQTIAKELLEKRNREINKAEDDRLDKIKETNNKIAEENKKAKEKADAQAKKDKEDADAKRIKDYQDKVRDDENAARQIYNNRKTQNDLIQKFAVTNDEIDKRFSELRVEYAFLADQEIYGLIDEELRKKEEAKQFELDIIKEIEEEKRNQAQKTAEENYKYFSNSISFTAEYAKKINELNQNINSNFASVLSNLLQGYSEIASISDEWRGKENLKWFEQVQKIGEYAAAALQVVSGVLNGIQQNNQARLQEDLTNIQNAADQAIAIEQNKLNQGLISQAEFDKKNQDIQFKAKQKEYEVKKKAFEDDKKLKVAQAIVSGLQGAVSAFAGAMQLGPIAGPIVGGVLAAAIAAMTAANVSKINSTKFGETAPVAPADAGAAAAGAANVATPNQPSPSPLANDFTAFGTGGGANNLMANQMVVKAVVSETEITNTQLKLAGYKKNAELADDFTNKG